MSKNTEIHASVSANAITAAVDPKAHLVFKNIPSLGAAVSATDAKSWSDSTEACAGDARTYADKKHSSTQQTVAMIVMDAQLHTFSFYETKLKEAGLGLPQKKDVLTYAFAWHLRLDVSDADKKKASDNSKALNRYVSAGRRLIALARNEIGVCVFR